MKRFVVFVLLLAMLLVSSALAQEGASDALPRVIPNVEWEDFVVYDDNSATLLPNDNWTDVRIKTELFPVQFGNVYFVDFCLETGTGFGEAYLVVDQLNTEGDYLLPNWLDSYFEEESLCETLAFTPVRSDVTQASIVFGYVEGTEFEVTISEVTIQ